MSTLSIPESKSNVKWYIVDAQNVALGRLASAVAFRLRGKHKPTFTPHVNGGDHVIVINADKIKITGNKAEQKRYYRHSGYPGGFKEPTFKEVFNRRPQKIIEHAVRGMLPKNTLGRSIYRKLKVYPTNEHPHNSQKPEVLKIN